MITIKNIQPLSAEGLFDLLKKDFTFNLNIPLSANMIIDYAHVSDIVNIRFPEAGEDPERAKLRTDDTIKNHNKNYKN
jgi:hypothetical protein